MGTRSPSSRLFNLESMMQTGAFNILFQLLFACICLICGGFGMMAAAEGKQVADEDQRAVRRRRFLFGAVGLLLFLAGLTLLYLELPFFLNSLSAPPGIGAAS
ncbi:hypothetical protein JW905_12970 [bacterium]|nr:hypothetical protein [candidate division CSSED10-310 bacterium]